MTLIAPDLTPLDDDETTEMLLALLPSGADEEEGLRVLIGMAVAADPQDPDVAFEARIIIMRNWAYNDRETMVASMREVMTEAAEARGMTYDEIMAAMVRGDNLAIN